jgi:SAM-dependent MidA family methyltransferase
LKTTTTQSSTLPAPDADALAHSHACAHMLREAIRANNGWLSFASWMEKALYAPGLGYYAAGARKFGQAGDFITAPEISSLFGASIADAISPTLAHTTGDVLELGPGSGKLAFDTLLALEAMSQTPRRYWLLEVSADLRERQRETLSALPPHLFARCEWLDRLPENFEGAVVANEVLDVVPTHLVQFAAGWMFERGVALKDDEFIWQDSPALPADVQAMVNVVNGEVWNYAPPEEPHGYLTEFAPQADALVASVMQSIKRGVALFIDYGFRRDEFYHPARNTGTLMCHYRHHAHTDPFLYPGLQDITAHVDFTSVANAAVNAGAEIAGFATQANFLLAHGITDAIAKADPNNAAQYLSLTNQAQRLLSPAEMGEFFKVLGLSKGIAHESALPKFAAARQLPL